MKLFFELIPLLAFFVAIVKYDLYVATMVFMIALPIQLLFFWLFYKKVEKVQLIVLVVAFVLGGATLFFKDPLFIKWKPTVVNWLLAVFFAVGQWVTGKPPMQRLLDSKITLPASAWKILNSSWIIFFLFLGAMNLYFAYEFDTLTWAKFKVFGTLGLTFLFVIGQAFFISRYVKGE